MRRKKIKYKINENEKILLVIESSSKYTVDLSDFLYKVLSNVFTFTLSVKVTFLVCTNNAQGMVISLKG